MCKPDIEVHSTVCVVYDRKPEHTMSINAPVCVPNFSQYIVENAYQVTVCSNNYDVAI